MNKEQLAFEVKSLTSQLEAKKLEFTDLAEFEIRELKSAINDIDHAFGSQIGQQSLRLSVLSGEINAMNKVLGMLTYESEKA